MSEKIFFISDSHLVSPSDAEEKNKYTRLNSFFAMVAQQKATLYILGDYFDFFYEYRTVIPKQCIHGLFLLQKLKEAGIAIHYITGNHDHWMDDFLKEAMDIHVYHHPLSIELGPKKILLLHGDGLSDLDRSYRWMRRILRHPVNRFLFRWLHPDAGVVLANRLSHASKQHDKNYEKYVNDRSFYDFIEKKFLEGYDAVLMGHHHLPKEEIIHGKVYINLGDWIRHSSYAEWHDEHLSLKHWTIV